MSELTEVQLQDGFTNALADNLNTNEPRSVYLQSSKDKWRSFNIVTPLDYEIDKIKGVVVDEAVAVKLINEQSFLTDDDAYDLGNWLVGKIRELFDVKDVVFKYDEDNDVLLLATPRVLVLSIEDEPQDETVH